MNPLALHRPPRGKHVAVSLAGHDALALDFAPSAAFFRRQGEAMLLLFGDGAAIEITDFFSGGTIPHVPAVLEDGSRLSAADLLALFAPDIALQAGPDLTAYDGGGAATPGSGLENLAPALEEHVPLPPKGTVPEELPRDRLRPVYQEVIIKDGSIEFGQSIYGSLGSHGGERLLHLHLDNRAAESLNLEDVTAQLPDMFFGPEPVRHIAVTGGEHNRVILDGRRLSARQGSMPLEGFGTTQFDRYAYQTHSGLFLTLYVEIIIKIER